MEFQTHSSQLPRNNTSLAKYQPPFPDEIHPDHFLELRTPCKNDNQKQNHETLQNVLNPGLNNETQNSPDTSWVQTHYTTLVRLPANCQWAIIDETGSVTPLPPGAIPAASKNKSDGISTSTADASEQSPNGFPSTANVHSGKQKLHDDPLELKTPRILNALSDSQCFGVPSEHEPASTQASGEEEIPSDRTYEKEPSPTYKHWNEEKGREAMMNRSKLNCKPLVQSELEPDMMYLHELFCGKNTSSALRETPPSDKCLESSIEQEVASSQNTEKRQRSFTLPIGWNSKNWFSSPFKNEKKQHRKTSTMPPSKNLLPQLLSIDNFSSLNISEGESTSPKNVKECTDGRKQKQSVYTLGEFLRSCEEEDDESAAGLS
jgi:hypothetical protein